MCMFSDRWPWQTFFQFFLFDYDTLPPTPYRDDFFAPQKKIFLPRNLHFRFFKMKKRFFLLPLETCWAFHRSRTTDTAVRENKQTCLYARDRKLLTQIFSHFFFCMSVGMLKKVLIITILLPLAHELFYIPTEVLCNCVRRESREREKHNKNWYFSEKRLWKRRREKDLQEWWWSSLHYRSSSLNLLLSSRITVIETYSHDFITFSR